MVTGDKDRFSSLIYRLGQGPARDSVHFIYKVPMTLRAVNNKAYEPETVAIGPYHHGKEKCEKMEEVKVRHMQSLLRRKPEVTIDSYLSAIDEVEDKARSYYAERIMPNSDKFVEMLVLDGCFIIQLISEYTSHEHTTNIPPRSRNSLHRNSLFRDLMLLENQIPLFVLCRLFDLIEGPEKHHILKRDVLHFCEHIFHVKCSEERKEKISGEEAKHILDLFRRICIRTPPRQKVKFQIVKHTLDLFHRICIRTPPCQEISGGNDEEDIRRGGKTCQEVKVQIEKTGPLQIPTASQLIKDSNVKFRSEKSRRTSLFDVKFDNGKMVMPTLVIDNGTESLVRNLIEYEKFLDNHEPTPVTDYAVLLNSLIDSREDVEILTRCGIIDNKLGKNQAVADFVNQLTHKIIYYNDNFMYLDIFDSINNHCNKNVIVYWDRAFEQLRRDYLASPWTVISLVAAGALLLLTIAQTVFAALQQFK